jgi:transcriptional regulator with XRE-family HTH domain
MPDVAKGRLYREIGTRIKRAREAHQPRLSQQQLADLLDVERTSITNIENGTQRATVYLLYLIARKLSLSLEALFPPLNDPLISEEQEVIEVVDLRGGTITRAVPIEVKSFVERIREDEQ